MGRNSETEPLVVMAESTLKMKVSAAERSPVNWKKATLLAEDTRNEVPRLVVGSAKINH
jgi:hypothetical protein